MTVLHAKIWEMIDDDFQQLINELYQCVGWHRDDGKFTTLWYLLGGIGVKAPEALSVARLPPQGILKTKIGKLPDGTIYDLCSEAANLKRIHLDDGKTVLSLLKLILPKPSPTRKPTRGQVWHDANTRVIRQRRANRDL